MGDEGDSMVIIRKELIWRGITPPPPGEGSARTTCPTCSPWRKKPEERCARVTIIADDAARLFCWHCGTEERIEA
jgi:hypothetical protein